MTTRAAVRVQSAFDLDNEGWTQMILTGDIRYVVPPDDNPQECTIAPPALSGILSFCDPDAGEWVFEAPAKFLGDQSAMFGGTISWRQHHRGDLVGELPPSSFRVVLANTNKAIAIALTMPTPAQELWINNSVKLEEGAGWVWADDSTGQEDLPPASATQIKEVLRDLTGFRIAGEFITGDDRGSLDEVVFAPVGEIEPPSLTVSRASEDLITIAWPLSAVGFNLEETTALQPSQSLWNQIAPPYQSNGQNLFITVPSVLGTRFYRLHKP